MYQKLDSSYFQTCHTKQGAIDFTQKEHSVFGYDENSIYFNGPMTVEVKKTPINDFREAWIQMEKQAITVTKSQ